MTRGRIIKLITLYFNILISFAVISSCSVDIGEEALPVLRGPELKPAITFDPPSSVASMQNQSEFVLSGECSETMSEFEITLDSNSHSVECADGQWQVELDLSNLPDGDHTVLTNINHPQTGDPISFDVTIDTTPPTISKLIVADDERYTNQLEVSLSIVGATDLKQVYITEVSDCSDGGAWQDSASSFTLSSGDNNKQIYYRLQDEVGNISDCTLVDRWGGYTIILDQTNPEVTNLVDDIAIASSKSWSWGCADASTCSYRYVISQNSVESLEGPFGSTTTAEQTSGDGQYFIHVQAQDAAGNLSEVKTVSVTLSDERPTVTLSSLSSDPLNSSFDVTVQFSEAVTGFIQSDVNIDNGAVSNFSGSGQTYTFTVNPSAVGLVTVGVDENVAQSSIGNGNTAATSLTRTFDDVAPTITGIEDDSNWTQSKTWSWGCNKTCTYRYEINTTPVSTPSGQFDTSLTATQNSGSGTYYLHLQAQDQAGNTTTKHVSALIDNTNPTAPSSIVDGSMLDSLSQSPTISFSNGTDAHSGVQNHEARVLRQSDDFVVQDWQAITSGSVISGLSLSSNTAYYLEIKVTDNVGNIAVASSDGWLADTTAPTAPTGLSTGAVPLSLNQSPTLSWSAASDTGGSGVSYYEAKIFRSSDNAQISSWQTLSSGQQIGGINLSEGVSYYFKVRAYDNVGNLSNESSNSSSWTPLSCPAAYVRVPADGQYVERDFCMAKFEMKNVSGVPTSQASNSPWNSISPTSAISECVSLGSDYNLISNSQWQAVARNIESVAQNWSGSAVGSGSLNRGHSDNSTSSALVASTNDNNACTGTGNTCSSTVWHSQRRTHVLSNGEVIWDFAGNYWEWTRDTVTALAVSPSVGGSTQELNNLSAHNRTLFAPSELSWTSSHGIGRVYSDGTSGYVLRGGDYNDGNISGIYAVRVRSSAHNVATFRCVYEPD